VFLQQGQQVTAWHAGLTVLPQAVVTVVMMPIAGRLYDRIGARWPAVAGLAVTAFGSWMMVTINIDATRPEIIGWTTVRAAGVAMSMMPIMTAGLSALPAQISNFGSAYNTLFQRVSSALGLSAMTALTTMQQAQGLADRSALLSSGGADVDPRIAAMQQRGPGGLIGLWQQTRAEVLSQAYSDAFLAITALTVVGIPLALRLRAGTPERGEGADPVEVG